MKSSPALVRELSRADRAALDRHLLALAAEDRRLRFGVPLSEGAVRSYVARIDFERDAAFGVHDEELNLLGAVHLARVSALFMHCLKENAAMLRLARRHDMKIVTEAGEADAWLALAPADASSLFGEVFAERVALFDYALKSQLVHARLVAMAGLSFSHGRREE